MLNFVQAVYSQPENILKLKIASSEYYYNGDYNKAATCFMEISKLYKESNDYESFLDYYNKYLNTLKEVDKEQALLDGIRFEQKIIEEPPKSQFLWALVLKNLADINYINRNYINSANLLKKVTDSLTVSGYKNENYQFFLDIAYQLSISYEASGLIKESIDVLENELDSVSEVTEKKEFHVKIARLYRKIRNYPKSNYHFFILLDLAEENSVEFVRYLNSIGNNYSKLNKPETALKFYLKSMDIRIRLFGENDPMLGPVYHNLGNMYRIVGNDSVALKFYNKSLKNDEEEFGESSADVGFVLNSLGNFYFDKEDYIRALSFYRKSLDNREKNLPFEHLHVIHSLYNIANSYDKLGEIDSAKYYINAARERNLIKSSNQVISNNLRNLDYLKDFAYTCWLEGEISLDSYKKNGESSDIRKSMDAFLEAVDSQYLLLKVQDQESSKLIHVKDLKKSIVGALNCQIILDSLYYSKNCDNVFNLFEKAHNSQLFELIVNKDNLNRKELTNDEVEQIMFLTKQLNLMENSDTLDYVENVASISNIYSKLSGYSGIERKVNYDLHFSDKHYVDLSMFMEEIDNQSLILQFVVSEESGELFYLLISKDEIEYGKVDDYTNFRRNCDSFIKSIKKYELNEMHKARKEISDVLRKIIIDKPLNRYDKIVIIPDGFLWQVPFDAISGFFDPDDYLIEEFDVLTHLSCNLSVWGYERRTKYNYDFVGFAPSFSGNVSLYSNVKEVENAGNKLREIGWGVTSFFGDSASIDRFIEYASQGRILHLASHFNYINDSIGIGLLLADGQNNPKTITLSYNDVLLIGPSPELIILSACNTAAEIVEFDAEGPINMNRAFIMNSTPNIIYSINKISDRFGEEFFKIFYLNLAKGLDFNSSFQKSKREILNSGIYRHPFYWSGFQMISRI